MRDLGGHSHNKNLTLAENNLSKVPYSYLGIFGGPCLRVQQMNRLGLDGLQRRLNLTLAKKAMRLSCFCSDSRPGDREEEALTVALRREAVC